LEEWEGEKERCQTAKPRIKMPPKPKAPQREITPDCYREMGDDEDVVADDLDDAQGGTDEGE